VCPDRRASPPLTAPSRLVDILGRVSSSSALVRMAAPSGSGKSWDAEAIETELRRLVDQFGRWPRPESPAGRASTASTARSARRNAGARAGRPPRRPGPGCRLDRRPDRDRLTRRDRPPPRMAAMAGLRRCRPPGPYSTSRGTETRTPGPSASESTASPEISTTSSRGAITVETRVSGGAGSARSSQLLLWRSSARVDRRLGLGGFRRRAWGRP
jgi:hypothetical protein